MQKHNVKSGFFWLHLLFLSFFPSQLGCCSNAEPHKNVRSRGEEALTAVAFGSLFYFFGRRGHSSSVSVPVKRCLASGSWAAVNTASASASRAKVRVPDGSAVRQVSICYPLPTAGARPPVAFLNRKKNYQSS